jgi:hypothetical protein
MQQNEWMAREEKRRKNQEKNIIIESLPVPNVMT